MQLVADVQNTATLSSKLAQHHEQLHHCLRCQHRRGFIQYQQLGVGQQGANNFYPLHFTHTQGMNGAVRLNVQTVSGRFVNNGLTDLGQT